MSLEGLDSAQLSEAFDNAQAEPGGWFWIKYITRDEVELLRTGSNGAGEMRVTALAEPDDAPLFGYIRFRRRNMLVKYVPAATSRVVKARSQVHFHLFAERFSPHDSIVTIASAVDLNESVLNSSCSTHTATASVSSSNSSLRQRRLTDIAESVDEGGRDGPGPASHDGLRPIGHSRGGSSNYSSTPAGGGAESSAAAPRSPVAPTPATASRHDAGRLAVVVTSHDAPGATSVSDGGSFGLPALADRDPTALFLSKGVFPVNSIRSPPSPSSPSPSSLPSPPPPAEPRRKSTSSSPSSARPPPPASDPDIYSHYPYVPKVKLGPRPHVEPPKRPHTSNERSKAFAPATAAAAASASASASTAAAASSEELRVAVPRSVHIPPRKTSSASSKSATLTVLSIPEPQPPPSPTSPAPSLYSFSVYSSSASLNTTAPDGPSPEKQRLMKALQLRRQQQQRAEQQLLQQQEQQHDKETDKIEEEQDREQDKEQDKEHDKANLDKEELHHHHHHYHHHHHHHQQGQEQEAGHQYQSSPSGEQTPTGSAMHLKDADDSGRNDPPTAKPESCSEEVMVVAMEAGGEAGHGHDSRRTGSFTHHSSSSSSSKLEGPHESDKSDEAGLLTTEEGEGPKDDGSSAGRTAPKQENIRLPETAPAPQDQDPALSPDAGIDRLEATTVTTTTTTTTTTKVRDNVDDESDGESITSLEPPASESKPRPPLLLLQSKPALQPVPVPVPLIAKSIHHPADRKPSISDPRAVPLPPRLPRRVGSTTIPANETPVIETARSVSAPFLKSARIESKPVTAKKVNVGAGAGAGGGSVSQRIRQFQQLATNPAAPKPTPFAGPPRTPTKSRSNSPIPEFLATRPQSSMSNKSPPRVNSVSHYDVPFSPAVPAAALGPASRRNSMLMPAAPLAPAAARNSMPQPDTTPIPTPLVNVPVRSKLEIVEKDNRPQLQVTTRINFDQQHARSPSVSPKSLASNPPPVPSPSSLAPDAKQQQQQQQQKAVEDPPVESTGPTSGSRRGSSDKEQRPRLFSRSAKDNTKAKEKDVKEAPDSMAATAAPPTPLTRHSSTASAKSSKAPGFLKRVGSTLSRKKEDPSPPPRPVPVEAPKKSILHAGPINVQLPDTMLWKRRFIKIDSDGWLCLALTDDENAPQTRKYYIASEVRKIDLPDVDEQELPHSVRLMLRGGGMLQCACQNNAEQKQLFSVVRGCLA